MLTIINVKETLAEALFEVVKTKDVKRVTVQDIASAAHTSRQTFYNHFEDKYALINWIYQKQIDKIMEAFGEEDFLECMKKTYSIFWQNKTFFTKVIDVTGQNSFRDFFMSHTYEYLKAHIINSYGEKAFTDDIAYSVKYNCYGQTSMCLDWIKTGMKKTPEEMAVLNIENIPIPIRKFFLTS